MTTGKVFRESTDIYQDQAKILFSYYAEAAKKIVSEEIALEQKKAELEAQKTDAASKMSGFKTQYTVGFIVAAVAAVGGIFIAVFFVAALAAIIFAVKRMSDYKNAEKTITECDTEIQTVSEQYRNIRRDYSVEKIGVAYVPVATKIPYEGKNFLIDQTKSVPDTQLQLNILHQPQELSESVQNLQASMKSFPVVESTNDSEEVNTSDYSLSMQNVTLHDYIGNIDRQVRNISYLLNDSENVTVELPAIKPGSEAARNIEEYATTETGDSPVVNVFGNDHEAKVDKFTTLNAYKNQLESEDDGQVAESMTKLMAQLAESVQMLTKEKNSSAGTMINYNSQIFANVLKAGFNQYSPALEADEIERIRLTEFDYQESVNDYTPFNLKKSSAVKLDIFSNNWVAEDGSRTSMPFGMQQVDEEVLAPVISALMEENRLERLKLYNNIEDQKREYLEKWSSEVGEYYRDNRKAADELISHMRETYADYMSSYNMYKSLQNTTASLNANRDVADSEVIAIDSEAEMLAGFEEQTKQVNQQQEQFSDFMDRIQDDINDITKDFAHINYYEGLLRDEISHETAVAMSDVHKLDPRRKQLVGISPFIAANAELQPVPNTSEQLMDAIDIDLEERAQNKIDQIAQQSAQKPFNHDAEVDAEAASEEW